MKIVCRTTNRVFVGLPINEQFTIDVFIGAQIINLFPEFLKPLVGPVLTKVPGRIKRAVHHIRPLVEEQLKQRERHGKDWPDKPNDLISWLFDEAKEIAIRVLSVNVAAIHTTTNALTHTLFNLAAYPEYVAPLREEVESVIEAEGWTKLSMQKMRKLESFIMESQRSAVGAQAMNRKILQNFTFSNGITLPAGTEVAIASYETHLDDKNYDRAHEFQGFRFSNMPHEGEGLKHQFVSMAPNYYTFGMGRHTCPGRFFAVNELKAMLVYILLNYDVKFPNDGPRPDNFWFSGLLTASRTAEVMFKRV
ncbi:cytochrome P450 [Gymnopilus junonius]|uniref:Cytochrome P450 n=1 Tax=Gymnopilus junonius TaxID=109634 RepID=A0A9P5NAV9_GYMJU|nr:cytochrome P450 [Gymnopilus junonius]